MTEESAAAAPPLPNSALVAQRLASLHQRIAAAGVDPADVEVVAVTKGFQPQVVGIAAEAGLCSLGENYAQEMLSKVAWLEQQSVPMPIRWHFIGHLQRNKVRQLAPYVDCFQSVDRPELVDELIRRARGCRVLVQVNTTGEQQKTGCRPEEVSNLVERALGGGLVVEGLMTVGPTETSVDPAPAFRLLRRLVDDLGLQTCSMGMTDDLETAVKEGSTMIRVGRALFGPRPLPGDVGN